MSSKPAPKEIETDVFIAGSGPIGCTYARKILDETKDLPTKTKVWMFEIGAQNDPVIGAHHKNSVKYQKDIDAFVHVIQGALQAVSVPPASTYMPTLSTSAATQVPQYHTKEARIVCNRKPEGSVSGQASNSDMPPCSWPQWPVAKPVISSFFNPNQQKELNLPGCRITRTVGGMATHWTCACPRPHEDEIQVGRGILGASVLEDLLGRAEKLLNVTTDQFSGSIRHNLVMSKLKADERFHDRVRPLPLAVKRENQELVTWSGTNTVLGDWSKHENCCSNPECTHENCRFALFTEYKVVKLNRAGKGAPIESALVHNLRTGENFHVKAKAYIIACGAVCTPQILWNSGFGEREGDPDSELPALGRYLTEQSLSFCQIVLNRTHFDELHSLVDIKNYNNRSMMFQDMKKEHFEFQQARLTAHRKQFEEDPIPIPFTDPEPQVNLKYTTEKPWHAQIHRDAFSYGDVGERADPRMVVDLRFFGKQEASPCNRVKFEDKYTDIYGLPQPTFEVHRSQKDVDDDQRMMVEMCEAAQVLGAFMPRSYPQFMEPGLALHITGTTRIGNDVKDSVANKYSEVHGHPNLYVGGNNVIPDSTACNPTLTSVAYALYSAGHIVENLKKCK